MQDLFLHIIPVSVARQIGLMYYYNGKLCPYGHNSAKHVTSGTCLACIQEKQKIKKAENALLAPAKTLAKDSERLLAHHKAILDGGGPEKYLHILTQRQAAAIDSKFFYLGNPCGKGHISERYTKGNQCAACMRESVIENRDKKRAYNAQKYRENPSRYVESIKRWVEQNRDKVRARGQRWTKNHPERKKAETHKRRAAIKGAEGKFTGKDIKKLLSSQKCRCACCRATIKDAYHVDHIMPLARGGTNWPDNLQLLCPTCNLRKSAKDPIAWAQENGRLL